MTVTSMFSVGVDASDQSVLLAAQEILRAVEERLGEGKSSFPLRIIVPSPHNGTTSVLARYSEEIPDSLRRARSCLIDSGNGILGVEFP